MKKSLYILPALIALFAVVIVSCDDDNNWETYFEWRDANEAWLNQQGMLQDESGELFYTRVVPEWNKSAYVYMHFFNDRSLTEGNLSPLYTSTISVKYIGRLYNDEAFDSSYLNTDSIFTSSLTDLVPGWAIALENMRVGDSARVLIPYQLGYGTQSTGSILPYSALQFDIKLVDIPYYEVKP
ncbi:MAG: FKBP-type peptidyl-prolyl cis-trans isomerase [Muribaculaceae bacterium]|nr:FKBP-type peptidyl-prolyl cis-trans isomerase [Muribaculaceae bacterium]